MPRPLRSALRFHSRSHPHQQQKAVESLYTNCRTGLLRLLRLLWFPALSVAITHWRLLSRCEILGALPLEDKALQALRNLTGGGRSLEPTLLHRNFPANREEYRDF